MSNKTTDNKQLISVKFSLGGNYWHLEIGEYSNSVNYELSSAKIGKMTPEQKVLLKLMKVILDTITVKTNKEFIETMNNEFKRIFRLPFWINNEDISSSNNESKKIDEKCPECKSDLYMKKSKKGSLFVGCSSWPKCNYVLNEKFYLKIKELLPKGGGLPTLEQVEKLKLKTESN